MGRDDRHLFVNIRVSPSEYQSRKVYLVTTSDITQRLETEQQLIQASKMATLGEMATGVAHELNQPLSVIKTSSGFFMKKIRKKEPIKEEILFTLAEEIDRHVDRATKIINHMRQFGRMSEVKMEALQVETLLKKAFDLFSQQLKVRGIEVEWELAKDLPEISANPDRLEQVFINLLINARDAIEDRWAGREFNPGEKKITLRTRLDRDQVVVEVADTGGGIPAGIADRIFEPFFTTKEVGKGTGLGLSISYSIVKEAGGDIRVSSQKEAGATFILTFPVPERHERE
jgi:histidine kinase